jgi:hypothetical protein
MMPELGDRREKVVLADNSVEADALICQRWYLLL